MRKNAKIVHFRDIDSFYPTLLAIIVACSATFYASIQNFVPDVWRHFLFSSYIKSLFGSSTAVYILDISMGYSYCSNSSC